VRLFCFHYCIKDNALTQEEAFYKTKEAINSLTQNNFPTKISPVLPVTQAGILRFRDDDPPP
jgi:hypothetical protein